MPQTISLVRGTTTVTGNGTTFATLFTNSASGIATRVIVNQLAMSGSSNGSGSYVAGSVYNNAVGAGETQIGAFYRGTAGTSASLYSFFPSNTLSNSLATSASGNMGTAGAPTLFNGFAYIQQNTQSTERSYCLLPQTFWIGPSDAIRMTSYMYTAGGKGGSPATVTLRYSFTLITES